MEDVGIRKVVKTGFEETLARVPEALKAEGFGVLTEIDVRDTLSKKLGVPFRKYRILGACNPAFAHRALQVDLDVGLMLPCNFVVYEGDDGRTVVTAIDPMQTVGARQDPAIRAVAQEVREKLSRVIAALN